MSGEDVVDELVRQVGEEKLALGQFYVLDRLHEAADPRVRRIHRESYDAETAAAVSPRQVGQILSFTASQQQHTHTYTHSQRKPGTC